MTGDVGTEPVPPPFRIVLIEDQTLFAEALVVALFTQGHDVRLVPVPPHGEPVASMAAAALRHDPALVLLDLDLNLGRFGDASRLIEPLVTGGARVVVVTGSLDERRWGGCLAAGAALTMTKTRPLREILTAVDRLRAGLPVLDEVERERLVERWRTERPRIEEDRRRLALLTGRESEVLRELIAGNTVLDIARASFVAEGTVRAQVRSILAKLGVSSQIAAVGLAHRALWAPPSDRDLSG